MSNWVSFVGVGFIVVAIFVFIAVAIAYFKIKRVERGYKKNEQETTNWDRREHGKPGMERPGFRPGRLRRRIGRGRGNGEFERTPETPEGVARSKGSLEQQKGSRITADERIEQLEAALREATKRVAREKQDNSRRTFAERDEEYKRLSGNGNTASTRLESDKPEVTRTDTLAKPKREVGEPPGI